MANIGQIAGIGTTIIKAIERNATRALNGNPIMPSVFRIKPSVVEVFPEALLHGDVFKALGWLEGQPLGKVEAILNKTNTTSPDLFSKSLEAHRGNPFARSLENPAIKPRTITTNPNTPSMRFEGTKNKGVTIPQADSLRGQGHIVNYKDRNSADVLRNKVSLTDDLGLSVQRQNGFVAPRATEYWPPVTPLAREYSNDFARYSRTGFSEIPDGTRYVGGTQSSFDIKGLPDLRFRANQEAILIDMGNDKVLKKTLHHFTKKMKNTDFNEEQKLELIMQYVDDIFSKAGEPEKMVQNFNSKKIYNLGDIIDSGAGVCRHRALLTKLLADKVGVKVSCVEGCYKGGGHMWTEALMPDGRKLLADPMHRAIVDVSNSANMHSKALNYSIEIDKKTGKLAQCYI